VGRKVDDMKEFGEPMVTISREEYDQLQECKALIDMLWMRFGPYDWPKEFRLPRKKLLCDFHPESDEFRFYAGFRQRINVLVDFDDGV